MEFKTTTNNKLKWDKYLNQPKKKHNTLRPIATKGAKLRKTKCKE
jgi:hypothetical protein